MELIKTDLDMQNHLLRVIIDDPIVREYLDDLDNDAQIEAMKRLARNIESVSRRLTQFLV